MTKTNMGRRAIVGAALATPFLGRGTKAAETASLISHRYPALEYYADKLKTALPDMPIDGRLMQATEAIQLQRLALSSGSSQLDLCWANSLSMASFAKSGWLEPLDDLWAKHKDEFKLGDINPGSIAGCSYGGHIYGMPITTNTLLYAYRADLFEEKKLTPATTWEGYIENAKALNQPPRHYGVTLALKGEMIPNELHAVLNTVGSGWFDKDWRPTFASEKGIAAIETYKKLAGFCVPGFTSAHNDEHTVNLGQDIAGQGQQWATRCASMDNPDKSRIVGKIAWTVMPAGGKQAMISDMYAISRYSAKNKEKLFIAMATALNETSQRGAAALATPPRSAVLNDPELVKKYRWYPAVGQCLSVGVAMPQLPEFSEISEIIGKRMAQAIVGQVPTKEALDTAATETVAMLTQRGYYK